MTLRPFVLCMALLLAPLAVQAQTPQESVLTQLQAQGFVDFTVNRTFLGRIRIVALSDDLRREIVFNPNTGEILRDFWEQRDGDGPAGLRLVDPRERDSDDSDRPRSRSNDDLDQARATSDDEDDDDDDKDKDDDRDDDDKDDDDDDDDKDDESDDDDS